MGNLGKSGIITVLIGLALIVVDMFLCMIALVCPAIGANDNYAMATLVILITALTCIVISIVIGITKIVRDL